MENSLHLIAHHLCPYVQRSAIVLNEKGIPFKRTDIDLANPPPWFTTISPMGKVPILAIDKKRALFESAVICEYLDESTPDSMHPTDALEKAYHRAWIEFGSSILDDLWILYNAPSAEEFKTTGDTIKHKFEILEKEIAGPFFSGETFRIIDAVYAPIFRYFDVFEDFIDMETFDNLTKVVKWRANLKNRPSVKQAVAADYPQRLAEFVIDRGGYLATFINVKLAS